MSILLNYWERSFNPDLKQEMDKTGYGHLEDRSITHVVPGTLVEPNVKPLVNEEKAQELKIKACFEQTRYFNQLIGAMDNFDTGKILGYRVVYPNGKESSHMFESADKAERFIKIIKQSIEENKSR